MEVHGTADLGDLGAQEKARWQTLDAKYKLVAQVLGGEMVGDKIEEDTSSSSIASEEY